MPDPFVTAQDLTDLLGRDVTADDGAVIALDAACDICRDISGQPFNRGTATLSFDGTGTDAIVLPYRPVNSVGTVTVNGTAEADYMVADHGVLLRGTAGGYPRPAWPEGRRNVTITYDYGFDTVDIPRSVRMVALAIAKRIVVQGEALQETLGDASVRYALAATDLTKGEERILMSYRRPRSF